MKSPFRCFQTLALGLAAACLAPLSSRAAASPDTTPSTTAPQMTIPQSVFVIPSTPKEGRNPFFPQSSSGAPAPKLTEAPLDMSGVTLNGITSPPKRTAMINGRTFEPGEEGEVKMSNGARILVKCEEIKTDSAVVLIAGQRRELRLRSAL